MTARSAPGSPNATVWPIRASTNNRHLVDANNQPFLYFATTPWMIGIHATQDEVRQYLDDRQVAGVNTVQVIVVPWEDQPVKTQWVSVGANRNGLRPFSNEQDFATSNSAYYDSLLYVIEQARLRNMQVALAPMWPGCCDEGWIDEMRNNSLTAFRNYGRFLGQKFGPKDNLMWIVGGDRNPLAQDVDRYNELVAGIRESDTRHLVTFHPGADGHPRNIGQSWQTLDGVYTYGTEFLSGPGTDSNLHVYAKTHQTYNRAPVQPNILIETYYEREHDSPASRIRRQPYWSVLSGSTGWAYGNRYWNMRPEDQWTSHLHDAGFDHQVVARAFFAKYPWWTLVPDQTQTWVTAGFGTYQNSSLLGTNGIDYVVSAVSADKRLLIAYVPPTGTSARAITVSLDQFAAGAKRASWVNPVNGQATALATVPQSGSQVFTTPGNNGDSNDWLLVVESTDLTATPTATLPSPTVTATSNASPTATPAVSLTATPSATSRRYYLPAIARTENAQR